MSDFIVLCRQAPLVVMFHNFSLCLQDNALDCFSRTLHLSSLLASVLVVVPV
jgi:hypothetical protein